MNLRSLVPALVLLFASCLGAPALADQVSDRANRVKAAFILNIAKFVSWPATALQQPDNLTLCTYRFNSLGTALNTITAEQISGRPLLSLNIEHLDQSGNCHILLVPTSELEAFKRQAEPGFAQPLLTIADMTDGQPSGQPQTGVLVALVRKGKGIGFEINLKQATKVGLRMRSELLKLAHIVEADS
ncbi:MAG: YfiR family protein [Gammaproteobacteria bacterium]|nr:YfiR family protein [Gammaproteobacteria bacterium]